jgi:hypothetical protein
MGRAEGKDVNINNIEFDHLVQRLQTIQPFILEQIDASGAPQPWQQVTGPLLMQSLVINGSTLRHAVDSVAAEIAHWGRLVAQTKRVWEVHERRYRHWRSGIELECLRTGVPGIEKSATQKAIECYYRVLPEYALYQEKIEAAEEAHNACSAIFDAFKAKEQQLRRDVRIGSDGAVTRFTP